jgi:hypothetical protein
MKRNLIIASATILICGFLLGACSRRENPYEIINGMKVQTTEIAVGVFSGNA